jgi:hypothetical protein
LRQLPHHLLDLANVLIGRLQALIDQALELARRMALSDLQLVAHAHVLNELQSHEPTVKLGALLLAQELLGALQALVGQFTVEVHQRRVAELKALPMALAAFVVLAILIGLLLISIGVAIAIRGIVGTPSGRRAFSLIVRSCARGVALR